MPDKKNIENHKPFLESRGWSGDDTSACCPWVELSSVWYPRAQMGPRHHLVLGEIIISPKELVNLEGTVTIRDDLINSSDSLKLGG